MRYPSNVDILPPPILKRECENPFYGRLNIIQETVLRIEECRKKFEAQIKELKERISSLSGEIRTMFETWFGKDVELKRAMDLMRQQYIELKSVAKFGDDVDLKMERLLNLKDEVSLRAKRVDQAYMEMDQLKREKKEVISSLIMDRDGLIQEYVCFHREHTQEFDWLSCDMQSAIKRLYEKHVDPYLDKRIDLFETQESEKTVAQLREVVSGLVGFREKLQIKSLYRSRGDVLEDLEARLNDIYAQNSDKNLWENTEVKEMLKKIEALKSQIRRLRSDMINLDTAKRV